MSAVHWEVGPTGQIELFYRGENHWMNLWAECGPMCGGGLLDLLPLLSEETLAAIMSEVADHAFDRAKHVHDEFVEQQAAAARVRAEENRGSRLRRLMLIGDGVLECKACGSPDNLVIDHIHPRSRGGTDLRENLQLLCSPCNSSKGAKTMAEWLGTRA